MLVMGLLCSLNCVLLASIRGGRVIFCFSRIGWLVGGC